MSVTVNSARQTSLTVSSINTLTSSAVSAGVVGPAGPQGDSGISVGSVPPTDTALLWVDTTMTGPSVTVTAASVTLADAGGYFTATNVEGALAEVGALAVPLPAANGTDDTTAIQTILTANAGKVIKGRPGQSYIISAPLVIASGTTLDMTDCTVTLKAGSNCNMLQNTSVATAVRSTAADAVVVSGNLTITSATGSFTSNDVGRVLAVAHTTANSGSTAYGTIGTFNSSTSVTITGLSILSQSGGVLSVYSRDTDITVRGGTWARGSNAGTGPALHSLCFRRCDRLLIENVTVTSAAGKFSINAGDCTNVTVRRSAFDAFSDGVHISGPATNITITDVSGTTGDDVVALVSSEGAPYIQYRDTFGNISGANVERVYAASTASALKMATADGATISGVRADGLQNTSTTPKSLFIHDDTGTIAVDDVRIANMSGYWLTGTSGEIGNITLTNCTFTPDANSRAWGNVKCDITNLRVSGLSTLNPSAFTGCHGVNLSATCTVTTVDMSDVRMATSSSAAAFRIADGTVTATDVKLMNVHMAQSGATGAFVQAQTAGSTLSNIYLSNCSGTNISWIVDTALTSSVFMANVRSSGGSFNIRATGNLTVYGTGITSASGPSITAGGVLRSKSLDHNVDTGLTGVAVTNGDMAYNTNAARGNGVGPCVANGTVFKNLYTGVTGP